MTCAQTFCFFLNFLLWSLFSIQWISLRELLTRCGQRLTVNELWALCYTCLSSLQTYIDFPGDINHFMHEIKVLNYLILTAPAGTVEIPTCYILAHTFICIYSIGAHLICSFKHQVLHVMFGL